MGTITSGTWQGGVIDEAYLDTDLLVPADFNTSAELAGILDDEEGTSGGFVRAGSPTFAGTADFSAIIVNNAFTLGSGDNVGSASTTNWGITTTGVITGAEWNGDVIASQYISTSTLNLALSDITGTTDDLTEGSTNLYFTNARADARIAATTSLPNLTTLANLATVGTITSGTWQGGVIDEAYLDTDLLVPADFDTSVELRNLFGQETGTGNVVFSASPTLTGTASGADIDLSGDLKALGTLAIGGANVNPNRQLHLDGTISGNAPAYGIYNKTTYDGTIGATRTMYSSFNQMNLNGYATAGNQLNVTGLYGEVIIADGNDAPDTLRGIHAFVNNENTGTTTSRARVIDVQLENAAGATVDTAYGMYLNLANSGAINEYYGIRLVNVVQGTQTNAYSFWTDEADVVLDGDGDGIKGGTDDGVDLFFGEGQDAAMWYDGTDFNLDPQIVGSGDFNILNGNVGIGTSTITRKLTVAGDVRVGVGPTGSDVGCFETFDGTAIGGSCVSDRNLKTNIEPLADTSNSILKNLVALVPVTYNWNEVAEEEYMKHTGSEVVGLIAQNVEDSFPELVSENNDGYKQVNFTSLQFYIIEAIREMWGTVTGNKEKIETLEDRIETLESLIGAPAPVVDDGNDDDTNPGGNTGETGTTTASSTDNGTGGGDIATSTDDGTGGESNTASSTDNGTTEESPGEEIVEEEETSEEVVEEPVEVVVEEENTETEESEVEASS